MSSKHSDHFLPFPTAVGGCQQDGSILGGAGGTTTRPHPCSASPQTPNAASLFCCAGGSALPWGTQAERLIRRVRSRHDGTGGQESRTAVWHDGYPSPAWGQLQESPCAFSLPAPAQLPHTGLTSPCNAPLEKYVVVQPCI